MITVITAEKPATASAIPVSILIAASGLEVNLSSNNTAAIISARISAINTIDLYAPFPTELIEYESNIIIAYIKATNFKTFISSSMSTVLLISLVASNNALINLPIAFIMVDAF